jgi:site-specific DNA-methyltransferase (adenine-specific)
MLDMLPADLWTNKNVKFLDPVTKSGVFLREIVKRLTTGLAQEIPDLQTRINHICTQQVHGIAITELTSLLARRSVYCAKTANSDLSICSAFDDAQGNIRFERTQHTWKEGKCTHCGASEAVYSRDETLETHAYSFIHMSEAEIEQVKNMKFDVIIGNPPYQLSDGGNGASASPIYQLFVQQSKKINPRYLTMIIPARWYAGGKGLDEFREKMLQDTSLKYLVDYPNAKECFPNNSIGGGICYFLMDSAFQGNCHVTNILNGQTHSIQRDLGKFDVFVRYNNAISIIDKVQLHQESSLQEIVSSRNPFGLSSKHRGESVSFKNSLRLHTSQGVYHINNEEVTKGKDLIGVNKVMISKVTSEHAGEPSKDGKFKVLSKTIVIQKNDVCTDSYLCIGHFDHLKNANNLITYLSSRFLRFLLLQAVTSINLSSDKFFFVPIQDFSKPWTDEKLYAKYGLTNEEIAFIESMIRPMDVQTAEG